jgi:predicted dehydrogenase
MNRRHFALASLASPFAFAADSHLLIAVIGHTGAGNYGHGLDTMWTDVPGCELVALADADDKGRAAAQKKLGVTQAFADYHEMLAKVQPDIVAIGPRILDEHHAMTMACVRAGVKGIYMEKPFCRTLIEADEIIAACDQSGTKLALAHRNRYHPVLPVVKQLVADGRIGRLLEYRARGKEDARGGALDLWVLGCHLFNLIHYFGGEAQSVSASVLLNGKPVTAADVSTGAEGVGPLAGNEVHARFELASGVPAFFDSVQNAGVKSSGFGLQLIGTEGVIDLRTDAEPTAHLCTGSPYRPAKEPRGWTPITSGGIGVPEPMPDIKTQVMGHGLPARDLIAAIAGKREPLCSARDARHTLEMVLGVLASHRANGGRVTLPLKTREHPWAGW